MLRDFGRALRQIARPACATGSPGEVRPGQFSILTAIYSGTEAVFLQALAESVFRQAGGRLEWVLLAHGPLRPDVHALAARLAADPRVKFLELPENRGIIGGVRACLEAATGEYVLPVDADDVLADEALAVMAAAVSDHGSPAFLFSDEDSLVAGRPTTPYLRPDWDPVLNLSGSYIWHLCAFRRETALALGVYSDAASNWCHDWDTVCRFAAAGHAPVHVPEVLYHWRSHGASTTNQPRPNEGSLASQKHVLEGWLARQPSPDRYEIEPFPLFRGVPEWWICRKRVAPPPLAIVVQRRAAARAAAGEGFTPLGDYPMVPLRTVGPGTAGLTEAARGIESGWVAVLEEGVRPVGDLWAWEAASLREWHGDLALVAGRILDAEDRVLGGGGFFGGAAPSSCPEIGRKADDPGAFALFLKPRSVDTVDARFFLADVAFLRSALDEVGGRASGEYLGAWLGAVAARRGLRVAASPLIAARAGPPSLARATIAPAEFAALGERFGDLVMRSRWHRSLA